MKGQRTYKKHFRRINIYIGHTYDNVKSYKDINLYIDIAQKLSMVNWLIRMIRNMLENVTVQKKIGSETDTYSFIKDVKS